MLCPKLLFFLTLVGSCVSTAVISSCSQKAFEIDAKNCITRFYGELRKNPKQDCRRFFSTSLTPCVQNIVEKCRNATDKANLEIMMSRAQAIISHKSYLCEDGMLNSFKNFKSRDCPERALQKARKCAQSFHKEFREFKGSPSLCRKFTKAGECILRALQRCKKSPTVEATLKMFRDSYNPHCPGGQERKIKPRNPVKPFGDCTEREYSLKTRGCILSFVRALQNQPKKHCRWAFMNKYYFCTKNIAFADCYKNATSLERRNLKRLFLSSRAYDEEKLCDGINFHLSYPRNLQEHDCEKDYVEVKEACESSYVATYLKNKSDESLCGEYADAKRCAKNATLSMCKVTQEQLDDIDFIYDNFNPFCSQSVDPPVQDPSSEKEEGIPPDSGDKRPVAPEVNARSVARGVSVVVTSSCSQRAFEIAGKSCVTKFYAELRKNPKQDCRRFFSKSLTPCVRSIVEKCRNATDKANLEIMMSRAQAIISHKSYLCKDGMLNSFKNFKSRDCPEKALQRTRKCAHSFHKEFREVKGSPSLCSKFTKARKCIVGALQRCEKSPTVEATLKMFRDSYNPHCPGGNDGSDVTQGKPVKSFGDCTEREYSLKTRSCILSFVHTLQNQPKKHCRWAFMNKYYFCTKNIAFEDCHKNATNVERRNLERAFLISRASDEQKFCDGIDFKLSYPRNLRQNDCEKNYVEVKQACESSYVETYLKNKSDKSLCGKYAEAKRCTKNVTLSMCKVTREQLDDIHFIYDNFNPFCPQSVDPPFQKASSKKEEVIPPDSGDKYPEEAVVLAK
ncbi:uncharacterized protein LOC141864024 isoform X2 [Acropora palmata]|uniref:uncharacterized protein LOC141864024 isoform X2 n=1 Tax=Acropora palmata TaxID=6131 RepID=UPI003DA115B8